MLSCKDKQTSSGRRLRGTNKHMVCLQNCCRLLDMFSIWDYGHSACMYCGHSTFMYYGRIACVFSGHISCMYYRHSTAMCCGHSTWMYFGHGTCLCYGRAIERPRDDLSSDRANSDSAIVRSTDPLERQPSAASKQKNHSSFFFFF